MSSFADLAQWLRQWPTGDEPAESSDPLFDRVRLALRRLGTGDEPGWLDIAGLLRHVLRQESLRRGRQAVLSVPRQSPWPTEDEWARVGVSTSVAGPDRLKLRAHPWSPDWLGPEAPFAAAFKADLRREHQTVAGDPAVADVLAQLGDAEEYRSQGQAEAVRAALLMPGGSTLLVCLPTGDGKSLVFQAPVLVGAPASITLVIVPTTALGIEQAARMEHLLQASRAGGTDTLPMLCYHGGLGDAEKQEIRRRIAQGQQPVVFASPEAVTTSLRTPLFKAARQGRLAYFVLDEAHLVAQWGAEFRPEFQLLAGLRASLLSACPPKSRFRTVLLSATVSEDGYGTLKTLFGTGGFQTVAAVSLRPEPSYWIAGSADDAERIQRVGEAVLHSPRPFLLYTAKRDDAGDWYDRLRAAGLKRVGLVRGGDAARKSGERALRNWRQRDLDAIVATSAFGLGMDQGDVRAVIHACIPENVDRFYQEVGRGGRDGRACASLLVHAPADRSTAQALNRKRIISLEKGRDRWIAMWNKRVSLPGDGWSVRIDAKVKSIDQDSDANDAWNVRTLVLMARANLIELHSPDPPELERAEAESEEDFQARRTRAFEDFYHQTALHLCESRHTNEQMWKDRVAPAREGIRRFDELGHARMKRVLEIGAHPLEIESPGAAHLNAVFAETYTVPSAGITPAAVWGNCPASRARGREPEPLPPAIPTVPQDLEITVDSRLKQVLGVNGRVAFVEYRAAPDKKARRRLERDLVDVMKQLARLGVVEFAVPKRWYRNSGYRDCYRHSPHRFVVHRDVMVPDAPQFDGFLTAMPLPRLSLVDPTDVEAGLPEHLLECERPLHVVILPETVPDTTGQGRRFLDTRPSIALSALLERVS